MKKFIVLAAALLAIAPHGWSQCTASCSILPVGAGGIASCSATSACGSGSWSVACTGPSCAAGSINPTSGAYTAPTSGPTVTAQSFSRGCQLGPNDSVFTAPINGLPVSSNNTQWMGRVQSAFDNFQFHTVVPGLISEYDNWLTNSSPKQPYYFYEGGFPFSGEMFWQPLPPNVAMEAGWSQDIGAGFDNHMFAINNQTCEDDEIYKPYVDFQTFGFVAGSTTVVNFTTKTIRTLQTPLHVWVFLTSGSLSGSCDHIRTGSTGWWATVTSQPNLHSGTGQLSIPFNSTGCNLSALQISSVNEGCDNSNNNCGPTNDNAQSGAIFPVGSNALISGSNAAGTPISRISIHPPAVYNNVVNSIGDPNCGGCVTAEHHAEVTTTSNGMLAPTFVWPATNNAYSGHPDIPVTGITNSTSPRITLEGTCDGSCISAVSPCSGIPQFSAAWNNCASPAGQQFYVQFDSCTGPWAALNGQSLVGTYVDSEDFTISFNTTSFGSYNGSCLTHFDWPPYGTRYRLKASFNVDGMCSDNSPASTCPYAKAFARQLQVYGLIVTDGTDTSDTWDSEIVSSEFDPDFIHDTFGNSNYEAGSVGGYVLCSGPGGNNFSNCLEIVDESSLNLNGAADGTTSNQRVVATFTGTGGTAHTDIVLQAPTVGVSTERIAMPAISGNTYQINAWVNGDGTSSGMTYTMGTCTPACTGASLSSSGLLTAPPALTQQSYTLITICSNLQHTACAYMQVFFIPVDSDGVIRLWIGGQQQTYTDHSGKVWWGTYPTSRQWQSNYEIPTGVGFASLFGTYPINQSCWAGVTDAQLYGTSISVVNDADVTVVVPNTTYTVSLLGEPGYVTNGPNGNVFDVVINGTVAASYLDGWVLAGNQACRPYTQNYQATVTNNLLQLQQQIRVYNPSDYEGISGSAWAITPGNLPPVITTTSLPQGEVTVAYSATINAANGVPPYTWSKTSGSLPAGLSLTSGCSGLTCTITGTPTAAGTSSFAIEICDSLSHCSAPANLSITIQPLPQITTIALPNGQQGQLYSTTLQAAGGIQPYVWTQPGGSLPPGLMLTSFNGRISGTPTSTGTYTATFQVTDANGKFNQKTLSIVVNGTSTLTITTTELPDATQNVAYSQTLQASGGSGGYTWSLASGSGPLPPGLTLSAGGTISGTPTTLGTYPFTVQVQDSSLNTATAPLSITVDPATLVITTPAQLPSGTVNIPYTYTLQASGGSGGYSWSLVSGTLPAGLTLNSSGTIQGTPTVATSTAPLVQVMDSESDTAQEQMFITTVAPECQQP